MSERPPRNHHSSVVALGEFGVMIRGGSGSGKSALALALLRAGPAQGLTAALVADDQVFLSVGEAGLRAEAPATIAGLIEIAGVGLVRLPTSGAVTIRLVVDLVEPESLRRLPLPDEARANLLGVTLRRITLPARQAAHGANVVLCLFSGGEIVEPPLQLS